MDNKTLLKLFKILGIENKKDLEIKHKEKYNFMKKYGKQKVTNKSRISENESISRFVGLIFFSGFICLIFGYYLSNEIALENFIKSFEEFDFGSTVVFLLIILICVLGSIEFKKFKKKKGKNFFNLNK